MGLRRRKMRSISVLQKWFVFQIFLTLIFLTGCIKSCNNWFSDNNNNNKFDNSSSGDDGEKRETRQSPPTVFRTNTFPASPSYVTVVQQNDDTEKKEPVVSPVKKSYRSFSCEQLIAKFNSLKPDPENPNRLLGEIVTCPRSLIVALSVGGEKTVKIYLRGEQTIEWGVQNRHSEGRLDFFPKMISVFLGTESLAQISPENREKPLTIKNGTPLSRNLSLQFNRDYENHVGNGAQSPGLVKILTFTIESS